MKIIAFDVHGKVAHFRRPDTTATHMTYPFIPPTAAKGLVGAILGMEDFITSDRIGVQLLGPVRTSAQQMSMLKDGGSAFNRPTAVELLVNPAYRIFYAGDEYTDQLEEALIAEKAVYHTYLGAAYAITRPHFFKRYEGVQCTPKQVVEAVTVVPAAIVESIHFQADKQYSRAGGFMKDYMGKREFQGSLDFLYERDGRPIVFQPNEEMGDTVWQTEDGAVCLV